MSHGPEYHDQVLVNISKLLSYVLRHKPEEFNIKLDKNGWALTSEIMANCNLTISLLEEVVKTNSKKRFEFNEDKSKIRACQGHSINVDLGLSPSVPPDTLYHGTATRFIDSIFNNGIIAGNRDMVHLSATIETAISVGSRHGKPAVILVNASQMHKDGYQFFLSHNGVWLTKEVPTKYLNINY